MTRHADVIVVGAGGVGSAALFHLARRGVKVLGIDRFPGGHDRGSSHGHTRIIRLAYFEHSDYVPLLRRAYTLWAELEQAQGEQLFVQAGLLEAGPPEGPTITGILASARLHQLAVEPLTEAECRKRFPGFAPPENAAIVFEPTAGVLRVERCVLAHLALAQRAGAKLVNDETVVGWTESPAGVEVTTDRNVYRAGRLIVTAGAWAGQLLASIGVPLEVRRKHVHWYPDPAGLYAANRGGPAYLFETPAGDFYGLPGLDGRGPKVGEHTGGTPVADPLNDDRRVDPDDRKRIETFLEAHLPNVARPALDHQTCFYTMSPDSHFLIDRHPTQRNVLFAAGLSGHGFKFTGVLGEALSDLAVDNRTDQPIGFLGLNRFAFPTSSQ